MPAISNNDFIAADDTSRPSFDYDYPTAADYDAYDYYDDDFAYGDEYDPSDEFDFDLAEHYHDR